MLTLQTYYSQRSLKSPNTTKFLETQVKFPIRALGTGLPEIKFMVTIQIPVCAQTGKYVCYGTWQSNVGTCSLVSGLSCLKLTFPWQVWFCCLAGTNVQQETRVSRKAIRYRKISFILVLIFQTPTTFSFYATRVRAYLWTYWRAPLATLHICWE